ncbi:ATP-dependent nuclease [Lysinibacillus endophyticus]|uniref:ATP-dependent nuclease n=1 Tax=Ureibacillus endophyticus TaxID=1978490 RepID=UPI00209E35FE|nr:AAA family ATPase [Lysinibacillus endophyticus]MCP1146150.1 AAA family ATPase [Lysinibacillus endophyticus]
MKLSEIIIQNFKGIGSPVNIKIDNIVALIGNNNVGKTTILSAYEAFADSGYKLSKKDFFEENIQNTPTIIGVFENVTPEDGGIAEKWIYDDEENNFKDCIKVKYVWETPDTTRKKYSFDPEIGDFVPNGTGGIDAILSSRVPTPIKISPLEDPATLEGKILAILNEAIKANANENQENVQRLITQIEELTELIKRDISDEIDIATGLIAEQLNKVFPEFNHVEIDIQPNKIETEKLIAAGSMIRVGGASPNGEQQYSVPLSNHGTGLQRTFLWSALKMLAETGKLKRGRNTIPNTASKILLIEEPEAFLHPKAIREAREALYAIAELEGWQVMTTTHSPMFIDLTKDHTTIIRIEKDSKDSRTIKTFSTEDVNFTEDERENLKMLNFCNPYFNEYFFAKSNLLVEGETEYTVVKLIQEVAGIGSDLHILNCFGKGNIVTVSKILNHFNVPYFVLHDADNPTTLKKVNDPENPGKKVKKKVKNGAWTNNYKIIEEVNKGREKGLDIKTFISVPNFEGEYLNGVTDSSKPYGAWKYFKENYSDLSNVNVQKFLGFLSYVNRISDIPPALVYETIEDIEVKVKTYINEMGLEGNDLWDLDHYNANKLEASK